VQAGSSSRQSQKRNWYRGVCIAVCKRWSLLVRKSQAGSVRQVERVVVLLITEMRSRKPQKESPEYMQCT